MAPLRFPHILPQQAWCSIPDFRPKDLHCPQLPYPPVRNPYALCWTSSSRLKENTVLVKVLLFFFPRRQSKKSPIQHAMAKIGITVSQMKENHYRDCNYSCSNIGYTHLISMSVTKEQIHCGGICSGNNDT